MKVISDKQNWETVKEKREKFLKQKQFPALKNPYSDRMDPIMHTGYLMFIRSKFLFLGLIENIEERNLYVSYAILKSFWENVTAFGYYYLRISSLLEKNNKEEAFSLSKKMGLGGRKFLTEEMVQKKGDTLEDYTTPNVLTMMEKVDEDWKRVLGIDSLFKELYETQIAEGGHTTYIGLSIAGPIFNCFSLLLGEILQTERLELPFLAIVKLFHGGMIGVFLLGIFRWRSEERFFSFACSIS